ncbi:21154_t:CDS:2, partial [Gigaspora rosea]
VRVSSGIAVLGLACILVALIGNIVLDPSIAGYFAIYFGTVTLHKYGLDAVIIRLIQNLKQQPVVFFTNTDELHILNK